jgi:hypothetical protein
MPSTAAVGGGGGGFAAELVGVVVELADGPGFPVFWLFDVLHAPTDTAVAPATARIARRISRGLSSVADINVSPSTAFARASGSPAIRPTMKGIAGDLLAISLQSAVCTDVRLGLAGAPSN